jgi:hypothetical protein
VKKPKKRGTKNGIFKKNRFFKEKRSELENEKRKRIHENESEKTAAKTREFMRTEKRKDENTEDKNDNKNDKTTESNIISNEKRIGKKKAISKNALQSAPPKIPK